LSVMEADRQRFKSAIGLSRLGLMNPLATSRQFSRGESFCAHVVDSHQLFVVPDTLTHPALARSVLVDQFGVRAYVGTPLMTSNGDCIGTLAAMDLRPRAFSLQEIEFLELTARWAMSEFERRHESAHLPHIPPSKSQNELETPSIANRLKVQLLSQLTQELRTPLTSVMGMASVLTREIYGPLTSKQKEYLGIIHNSGQYLLSLVNEILELSVLQDTAPTLDLAPVDIEMLCQQAINTLEQAALRREQEIRLSVEPGRRIWLLDKDKVRQMIYHLIFGVIQSSSAGSIVRLHVSQKEQNLTIALWVSHPWLGEGLPYPDLGGTPGSGTSVEQRSPETEVQTLVESGRGVSVSMPPEDTETAYHSTSHAVLADSPLPSLGLLLSQQLATLHRGQITLQGTPESGYRYLLSLPQVAELQQRI
jgi:signal transduction histidine kinase